MVATFPTALADLADLLKIRSVAWSKYRQQEMSGLGSGEFLTADLAPELWEAKCETAPMALADADQLEARFELLNGSANTFLLYNPRRMYPQADLDGSTLGASTVTISAIGTDRNTVTLAGLPAGYVITLGDMFSVVYSTSRRALIRFAASATASGAGALGPVEVRPLLRSGITTTLEIDLTKPCCKVKLVPGSFAPQMVGTHEAVISFTARQTLAA